jgi:hypothetical protein
VVISVFSSAHLISTGVDRIRYKIILKKDKNKKPLSVMLFPERDYPFSHSFLTEVYGKLFVSRGHNIVWITYARGVNSQSEWAKWNGAKLFLLRKCQREGKIYRLFLKRTIQIINS